MDHDIEQAADKAAGDPVPAKSVVCKSTMYGAGCGHPINDHDGNQQRDCVCCSWRHNDPAYIEAVEAGAMAGIDPERWATLPERTRESWRETTRGILAAAAPLIVADRENRIARRALKDLDTALAEVDRLTAERDAALALPEKIAAEIEGWAPGAAVSESYYQALGVAAEIARRFDPPGGPR